MNDMTINRRTMLMAASGSLLAGLMPQFALAQASDPARMSIIAFPEPPTLFIGLDQNGSTQTVAGKMYESLLTFDFDFTPRPSLAESWEISDDKLTYTFKLVKNAKWHDGKPFTADDVVFTTKEFLTEVHPRARAIFANCETIEAVDEHTVRFVLKKPFAPFLMGFEMSTAPMIPAHLYRGTDFRANPNNNNPIGTGPFKLAEWKRGSFIRLVKNPDYHGEGEPHLEEIIFPILPDASARAVAIEQGQVQQAQFFDVEMFDVQRLAELPNVQLITKGYEFYAPLARIEFNTRVAPFNDKRFRQAICYALDKQMFADTIFFGLGKPAVSPFSYRTRFYDDKVKTYEYDIEKAQALLDEMGLKPDANGVRTRVTFLRLPWGETWSRFAEMVKQSLALVGIEVEIEAADPASWTSRYANWDFQMTSNYPYQFGDPALGVSRFFVSSNIRKGVAYSNCTGYSNPDVDALFDKGASATSDEERQAAYSEVQKILTEDVPMAWLVEVELPTLLDKKYEDVVVSAIGVNESYRKARKAS
ncbi:MAG TPA: ABC transporter substrate-binding protein [Rhizobiaceae bacterium]|nr:ABC transporter substrate-binding protein [Rhizobiaceae bacterium]